MANLAKKSSKKNLISIDDLSIVQIEQILKRAEKFYKNSKSKPLFNRLKNKILVNFFFENSTRTRLSFEIAAKRAGAEVVNVDIALSSLKKGETISDMASTINAMNPDFVTIRHNQSGATKLFEKYFNCPIINAGDGSNEHPTQALLDAFTILQHKKQLKNLKIVICGDVLHSRVARSNLKLLSKFGADIHIVTLPSLMPKNYENWLSEKFNAKLYDNFDKAIVDADAIMMLRIQQERISGGFMPSFDEYFKYFGLNQARFNLAKKDAIILHPGPVNRKVEIADDLVEKSDFSKILNQVEAGVAVRRAILEFLC